MWGRIDFKEFIMSLKRSRCRKMKEVVILIAKVIADVRMLPNGYHTGVRFSGASQTKGGGYLKSYSEDSFATELKQEPVLSNGAGSAVRSTEGGRPCAKFCIRWSIGKKH